MNEDTSLAIASTKKRMGAFVIDDMIIAGLLVIIFYGQLSEIASHLPSVITPEAIEVFKQEMNQFSVYNLPMIILLKVLYHTFFVWQNGRTLGKYFMKIRVVNIDTQKNVTFAKALLRASLRVVSEVIFYLGFLLAFFLPLKQTLHDKLSESVVIDG